MVVHDVTPLITVDPFVGSPDSLDEAVVLVGEGRHVTVADDETAKALLGKLGLTEAEAADQVRVSYGPLA